MKIIFEINLKYFLNFSYQINLFLIFLKYKKKKKISFKLKK
jgi:hypothetical protein